MNNILRKIKKNPDIYIMILVSIIILIIGLFTIGFIKSIFVILILNIIFQIPNIIKYINNKKKKNDKPTYDYKAMNNYHDKKKIVMNDTPSIKKVKNDKEKIKMKKKKNNSSNKKKKNKVQKVLQIILLVCFIGSIMIIFACIAFFLYIMINSPKFNPDALYKSEPSYLYATDGTEMASLGTERRI